MEALLLTQGWRKYSWNDILPDSIELPAFKPEVGFSISGSLNNLYKEKRIPGRISLASFNSNGLVLGEGDSDENGRFSIHGLTFYDTAEVLLQAQKYNKNKTRLRDWVSIKIDEEESPFKYNLFIPSRKVDPKIVEIYEQERRKIALIEEQVVFDQDARLLKQVEVIADRSENDPFKPDKMEYRNIRRRTVLDNKKEIAYARSLNDVLSPTTRFSWYKQNAARMIAAAEPNNPRGIFSPGEQSPYQGDYSTTSPTGVNQLPNSGNNIGENTLPNGVPTRSQRGGNSKVVYLLNGEEYPSEFVSRINPSEVYFIDEVKNDAWVNREFGAGTKVVAIWTRDHVGVEQSSMSGRLLLKLAGFSKAKEFYSPNYEVYNSLLHSYEDVRTTLYWEPEIEVKDKTANVSFFTSDRKGTYDVIIEGLSERGVPVYKKSSFTVE
jgi:hypothetical protein